MLSVVFLAWLGAAAPPLPWDPVPDGGVTAPPEMTRVLNETLGRLAREQYENGVRQLKAGQHPAALEHLRQAYAFNPADPAIAIQLAVVHQSLGNHAQAEPFYRLALQLDPGSAAARLGLAGVLRTAEPTEARLEEAAVLLTRARELRGNDSDIILQQARLAALRHRVDEADRFYADALALLKETNALRLEMGDYHRGVGREEEALEWYRRVRGDVPDVARARERIRDVEVERQARQYGWSRTGGEVPARARSLQARARQLMVDHQYPDAQALLAEALRLAPAFTAARTTLGDLLRATGRPAEAELEYLRALALDPNHADLHARLGELCLADPENPRAAEAVGYWTRALQLRPERTEWNLPLARALRLTGDLPGALQHANLVLSGDSNEDIRRDAQLLKNTLETLLPQAGARIPEAPDALPRKVVLAERLGRARAYLARGETDAAVMELNQVPAAQRNAETHTLMGRIMHAADRRREAVLAFEAALKADERQGDVHVELGALLVEMGQAGKARAHLERALELGEADAHYHLARIEHATFRRRSQDALDLAAYEHLWRARARAAAFLRLAPASVLRDDARALQDELDRVAVGRLLPLVGLLALLGVVLGTWWRTRFGGVDLKALITAHPETGPDVQRVLAAIRHEVLKHNTMVLSGVVEGLERGQDISAHARHLRDTLVGTGAEPAVQDRLQGYQDELLQIGRGAGVRLNLVHKDAALRALNRGFLALRRAGPLLDQAATLSPRRRRQLVELLREAAELLNARGYEAVRALLDELRVLRLDRDVLNAIYTRTCREAGLKALSPRPLALDVRAEMPLGVCMPRAAFEDVLQNLFRNALQASARAGVAPEVGLGVEVETHPVTGHERVLLVVRDRAPALDLGVILSQRIEGGLGLTAELVSRYDGSLDVVGPHDGWNKAVVVKLPREDVEPARTDAPAPAVASA